jgi:hypothetical protein
VRRVSVRIGAWRRGRENYNAVLFPCHVQQLDLPFESHGVGVIGRGNNDGGGWLHCGVGKEVWEGGCAWTHMRVASREHMFVSLPMTFMIKSQLHLQNEICTQKMLTSIKSSHLN